jgi:hypothetical protein
MNSFFQPMLEVVQTNPEKYTEISMYHWVVSSSKQDRNIHRHIHRLNKELVFEYSRSKESEIFNDEALVEKEIWLEPKDIKKHESQLFAYLVEIAFLFSSGQEIVAFFSCCELKN